MSSWAVYGGNQWKSGINQWSLWCAVFMLGSGVHLVFEPVILSELFCQQEVAIKKAI